MIRINRSGTAVGAMAVASLAVGCCDKEQNQIAYLSQQSLDLTNKNKDLRNQLVSARTRESQLLGQADAKDLEVNTLRTENDGLKRQLAAKPAGGTGALAPGAEVAVYKVTVGSDILFDPGKASLTAAGRSRLNTVISTLKSQYAGMGVRVYGYTDSDPIKKTRNLWTDNLDLSANRSMAVTRYLISKGIRAADVETIGMGSTHFVAGNQSKADKAKNRRVVIVVVKR